MTQIVDSGLDHVFTADHVSFHHGMGMDGIVNAATLSACDPRLHVVIGVYLLALRHPITVARQLSTLATNAPGQVTLGVGVGGEDRNEIAMCGVDPRTRGRRTDECLSIISSLLDGANLDHDGEFFKFEEARIRPIPDPHIPILIGGRSNQALERAARFGDGWLAIWCSVRRFTEALRQIDDRAAELDRSPPASHGLQIWVGINDDRALARQHLADGMQAFYRIPFERFEKYSPYGSAEQVAEALVPYRDAGCRLFNLMPSGPDQAAAIDGIAQVKRLLT